MVTSYMVTTSTELYIAVGAMEQALLSASAGCTRSLVSMA